MTDASEIVALVNPDLFEVDNGDGTITVLEGNPRYCPQEQVHEGHEFHYAFLDRHGDRCVGAYYCTGEPAPWAPQSGSLVDPS